MYSYLISQKNKKKKCDTRGRALRCILMRAARRERRKRLIKKKMLSSRRAIYATPLHPAAKIWGGGGPFFEMRCCVVVCDECESAKKRRGGAASIAACYNKIWIFLATASSIIICERIGTSQRRLDNFRTRNYTCRQRDILSCSPSLPKRRHE